MFSMEDALYPVVRALSARIYILFSLDIVLRPYILAR